MRIQLTENYYTLVDSRNFILYNTKMVPDMTVMDKFYPAHKKEELIGYYPSIKSAIESAIKHAEMCGIDVDTISLNDYVERVEGIRENLLSEIESRLPEIKNFIDVNFYYKKDKDELEDFELE